MHEFIEDRIEFILEAISFIEIYLKDINCAADFEKSTQHKMQFDAILMRLQTIGENVKKINKIDERFFSDRLHIDTDAIIRFRDLISHHYEKTDTEIVYEICQTDIPLLKKKLTGVV